MSLCRATAACAANHAAFSSLAVHGKSRSAKSATSAATPPGPRDAARGRRPAAPPPRPGSSTPLPRRATCASVPYGSAAPCSDQNRHADVGERVGGIEALRSPDRATRRSSRGTPRPHPRDGARAARAGRSSRSVSRVCGSPRCSRFHEEMRRDQHEPAHAMILHAAGVDGRDGRAVAVAEQDAARESRSRRAAAAARRSPRAACSRAAAAARSVDDLP